METLNSDCLLKIFLELDLQQKIQIERVCKKWCRILRSHYAYSNIQKLNILDYMQRTNLNYFQQENINFIPTIVGLLTRCGPYLREISFGSGWYRISVPITKAISEHCKQLRMLDLSCTILNSDISIILEQISHQLTYFSIEESNLIAEENVEKIGTYFKQMKKLKSVNLRKCRINMNHILDLPEQLEDIDLSGIHHIDSELIICFLIGHSNIKGLTLNPFPGAQFPYPNLEDPSNGLDLVLDCIASMPKLEQLSLGSISYDSSTLPMNCLSKLTNLRVLELKECLGANDNSLTEILINATQLESLTIINCAKICDFSAINLCKNLKSLTVEKSYHICDDDIKSQTKLEKLKLKYCYNVTCKTVQHISFNCPIKELDLSFCNCIDDSIFAILSMAPIKLRKLLLDGCKITNNGALKVCDYGKNLLKTLIELDVSHNKYITNECVEYLIKTVSKVKRVKTPLRLYLSQTAAQPEHFHHKQTSKRVELIF